MGFSVRQGGDSWSKTPGTSNQTGNRAPQFSWQKTCEGRVGRTVIHCSALYEGFTDNGMANTHNLPSAAVLHAHFVKLLPWFEELYNQTREAKARERGYTGPMEPFNAGDVRNRLIYEFAKPGRRKGRPRRRLYGISSEHHTNVEQHKPGGRDEVWVRCSEEIMRRLASGQVITREEAMEWGA